MPQPPNGDSLAETLRQLLLPTIAVGAAIILAAITALWWSEHRTALLMRDYGRAIAGIATARQNVVEEANDGRLVLLTGAAAAGNLVQDDEVNVLFPGALVVRRTVEIFDTTTIGKPAWVKAPPESRLQPALWTSEGTTIGAFTVSSEQLKAAGGLRAFTPHEPPAGWVEQDGALVLSESPANPRPGDIRIRYAELAGPVTLTVLARQTGNRLSTYNLRSGLAINEARTGAQAAETMLAGDAASGELFAWLTRFLVLVVMWGGCMISMPVASTGLGWRRQWFATSFAVACASTTAAVAWLTVSPALTAALVIAAMIAAATMPPLSGGADAGEESIRTTP